MFLAPIYNDGVRSQRNLYAWILEDLYNLFFRDLENWSEPLCDLAALFSADAVSVQFVEFVHFLASSGEILADERAFDWNTIIGKIP